MREDIRTPDQRLRVFVSSTLGELAPERTAVRSAIERLRLTPVMFELGARPHPPRELYRAYLAQSHVFVGIYWQRYGWVAPGETVSGLEDEYRLAGDRPRLMYIKEPAPEREERLHALLRDLRSDDLASYKSFATPEELAQLVADDMAVLLSERFGAKPRTPISAPPVPPTETVGRSDEVAAVADMLRRGTRLVTVTGAGGIGKTRLAIEVARTLVGEHPGGVHFIPLAPVTDPDVAVRTIADRLAVRVEGAQSVFDAVVERLQGPQTLLVLDNLEQVIEARAQVAELLEQCSNLRVLTTSRQALRIRAEHEVPLGPLALPDPSRAAAELSQEPAVRLFIDRARASAGGFELTDTNAADVAEICVHLDGLPLAIELAAARIRLLSPGALLERLRESLDILSRGPADLPDRQRTLSATIEWSHRLLDADEQVLFARLSVFAGSLSLEGAQAVCGRDLDVMETLGSLLDKNLLVVDDENGQGEPRFRMLATVRAFAAGRLAAGGEEGSLTRRHLDWYRYLADLAQPFLCGPNQREWAADFDPERANLRAAVETALELGDHEAVIELVWDVAVYYEIRDAAHETRGWLERVVAAERRLDEVAEAKLRSMLAIGRITAGSFVGTKEPLESGLDLFRSHEMDFETAVVLLFLGSARYVVEHDLRGAETALDESSRLFESVAHDWGVSNAETTLGTVLMAEGRLDDCDMHQRRSLEFSRKIENEPLEARALQQLALSRILSGRPDEALPFLDEAAEVLVRGRYQSTSTLCLDALAAIALSRGDDETASRAVTTAEAVRRRLGIRVPPMAQEFVDGLVAATAMATHADGNDLDVFRTLTETLAAMNAG